MNAEEATRIANEWSRYLPEEGSYPPGMHFSATIRESGFGTLRYQPVLQVRIGDCKAQLRTPATPGDGSMAYMIWNNLFRICLDTLRLKFEDATKQQFLQGGVPK